MRFEGALATAATSTGEQMEPVVEPGEQLVGTHHGDAGGGELDGEGDAVEAGAELGDGGAVGRGEREVRAGSAGAVEEELDGVVLAQ